MDCSIRGRQDHDLSGTFAAVAMHLNAWSKQRNASSSRWSKWTGVGRQMAKSLQDRTQTCNSSHLTSAVICRSRFEHRELYAIAGTDDGTFGRGFLRRSSYTRGGQSRRRRSLSPGADSDPSWTLPSYCQQLVRNRVGRPLDKGRDDECEQEANAPEDSVHLQSRPTLEPTAVSRPVTERMRPPTSAYSVANATGTIEGGQAYYCPANPVRHKRDDNGRAGNSDIVRLSRSIAELPTMTEVIRKQS